MSREEEITKILKQHGERLRHLETVERSAAGTSAHKDTHDPQTGTDPLDCGAPTTILAQDTAPAESATDELARSGHVHGLDVGIPASILAQNTAAAEGGSTEFPRKDHVHGIQVGVPSDIGVANAEGGSTEFVRKDHAHNHPGLAIEPFDGHLNNPAARVYRSTDQVIGTGAWTSVSFDTEQFDTDNIWVIGSPTRLTCQKAGIYQIGGGIMWAASASATRRILRIYLGGATEISVDERDQPLNNLFYATLSTLYQLAVGNFLELQVYQNTGGNLNLQQPGNAFWMVRVG